MQPFSGHKQLRGIDQLHALCGNLLNRLAQSEHMDKSFFSYVEILAIIVGTHQMDLGLHEGGMLNMTTFFIDMYIIDPAEFPETGSRPAFVQSDRCRGHAYQR